LYAKNKDTVRKDGVFVLVLEETLDLLKIKDLNCDCCYVLHGLQMSHGNTDFAAEIYGSSGTHLLPNLVSIRDLMIQYMERKTRLQESAASVL